MRHPAGELAEDFHLLRLAQLVLEPLAFGDVDVRADEPLRPAGAVGGGKAAAAENPAPASVPGVQAKLDLVGGGRAVAVTLPGRQRPGAVVGVEEGLPGLQRGGQLVGAVAQHGEGVRAAIRGAGLQVEVVQAVVGGLEAQAVFAGLPGLLGLFALSDVARGHQHPVRAGDGGPPHVDLDPEEAARTVAGVPVEHLRPLRARRPQASERLRLGVGRLARAAGGVVEQQHLCAVAPPQFAGPPVHVDDHPGGGVVDEDGVMDRVEDRGETLLARQQRRLRLPAADRAGRQLPPDLPDGGGNGILEGDDHQHQAAAEDPEGGGGVVYYR